MNKLIEPEFNYVVSERLYFCPLLLSLSSTITAQSESIICSYVSRDGIYSSNLLIPICVTSHSHKSKEGFVQIGSHIVLHFLDSNMSFSERKLTFLKR